MLRVLPGDLGYYLPGTAMNSAKDKGLSSSAYIIAQGQACGIIDTGLGARTFRALVSCLGAHRLTPRWVIFTHDHYDHVANGPWIRRHYNVPLLIHSEDRPLVEQPLRIFDDDLMRSHYSGTLRDAFEDMNRFPEQYQRYQRQVSEDQYHPVSVDETVEDGDTLQLEDFRLRVLHTPGHSPGSISLYEPSHGAVFAGDLPLWLGPGRPYPLGNYSHWKASMDRLLALSPRFIGWGHSIPTSGQENCRRLLRNTLRRVTEIGRAIEEQLSTGERTTAELLEAMDLVPAAHREMAEHSVHAILASLRDEKKVATMRVKGMLHWGLR